MTRTTDTDIPPDVWAAPTWPWSRPSSPVMQTASIRDHARPGPSRAPDTPFWGLGTLVAAVDFLAACWPKESAYGRDQSWRAARLNELRADSWPTRYWRTANLVEALAFGQANNWDDYPEYWWDWLHGLPGVGQHYPGVRWSRSGDQDVTEWRVGLSHRLALQQELDCASAPPVWLSLSLVADLTTSHRRTRWPLSLYLRTWAGQSLAAVQVQPIRAWQQCSLLRCRAAPTGTDVQGYAATWRRGLVLRLGSRWETSQCTPGAPYTHVRADLLPVDPAPKYGGGNLWGESLLSATVAAHSARAEWT